MFMGAMVAKQHNPVLKAFFDRLVAAPESRKSSLSLRSHASSSPS
jgi:hypothetical protein